MIMDVQCLTPALKIQVFSIHGRIICQACNFYHLGPSPCPYFCPTMCPQGQNSCPGLSDANGCPMADTCMPKTFGTDGNECPIAGSCPVNCPNDHFSCDGGFDDNGCKKPNTCVPNQGTIFSVDISAKFSILHIQLQAVVQPSVQLNAQA